MYYQGRSVLVTGAAGLLGSHLVAELLKRDARVTATVHRKPPVVQSDRVRYVTCDLTRPEDCRSVVQGVDYVFLCAANSTGAAVTNANPAVHVTPNLLINAHVLEAASEAKVNGLLYVSSTTVYPPVAYAVREDEGFSGEPYDLYFGVGWMKRYTEKLAEFFHRRYGLPVALVRPTAVYGPYDKFDHATSHVLPALIRRALEGEDPFVVWGDGTAVRDFVYATDVTRGLLAALGRAADCQPINLGSGQAATVRECVELILKLTGWKGSKVVYDPSKPNAIPYRQVDITRARERLGYRPQVSLEEGLRCTIDWYKSVRA